MSLTIISPATRITHTGKDNQENLVKRRPKKVPKRISNILLTNRTPRFMSSSTGVAGSHPSVRTTSRIITASLLRKLLIAAAIFAGILMIAAVLCAKYWPFSEKEVRQDLAEASDSAVTIRSYHPTYFPPGCTLEGIEFHHEKNDFKLITINKLVVEGS